MCPEARPVTPERQRFEFGAYGHGPDAGELAHRMVQHIQQELLASSLQFGGDAVPGTGTETLECFE